MKPTQNQIAQLNNFLQSLHGARLPLLAKEADVFAKYLGTLGNFQIIDASLPNADKHIGRVIVDGVLQVASSYEKQVRKVVRYVSGVSSASTTSGFMSFVQQHQRNPDPQFKVKNRENALLMVAEFFKGKGIQTFDDLYKWLETESHRDSLLTENSGLQLGVFRIANKTADYFRVLVRHWDAVAVDSSIRQLLDQARIISQHSGKYEYKEMRTIVQLSAVSHLDCRPVDLDTSIYDYNVSDKSGGKRLPRNRIVIPWRSLNGSTKYCIHCGVAIPHVAEYCPKCGSRQQ